MEDLETKAALERINERNLWTAGWFLCVVVTLLGMVQVAEDWHLRSSTGKTLAVLFVLLLVTWPIQVGIARKRRRTISSGALFMSAYLILMLAIQAFGPLAHAR